MSSIEIENLDDETTELSGSIFESLITADFMLGGRKFHVDLAEHLKLKTEELTQHLTDDPGILAFYGELHALAAHTKAQTKAMLDLAKARARYALRAESSGKKLTVQEFDDLALMDEDVQKVQGLNTEAEYLFDRTKAWFNAAAARGRALQSLAALTKAEFFVNDKAKAANNEDTLRQQRRVRFASNKAEVQMLEE